MRRARAAVVAMALTVSLAVVAPGSPALAGALTCDGEAATWVGTDGADVFSGTPGRDVVVALAGDDVIETGEGDDVVCGGPGKDRIDGGDGDDRLEGGPGRDRIDGGADEDEVLGGRAADVLRGGPGDDLVDVGITQSYRERLTGDAGDDVLLGNDRTVLDLRSAPAGMTVDLREGTATGEGADSLAGIRAVKGSHFDDLVLGTAGDDVLEGSGGDDVVRGRAGDDLLSDRRGGGLLVGGPGRDDLAAPARGVRMRGGAGDDAMSGAALRARGGAGDDRFFLAPGPASHFHGGPGTDLGWFKQIRPGVRVDLRQQRVTGGVRARFSSIEGVEGTRSPDVLIGDGGPNLLIGNAGDDVVRGRGGDDDLIGRHGKDLLVGGAGSDTCRGERTRGCEVTRRHG